MLRPKEAMLVWVLGLPGADTDLSTPQSLAQLIPEMSAFLLIDDGQDAQQYVRRRWREVREAELSQWTENHRLWPPRVRKVFDTWFNIEIHDLVFELK